MSETGARLYTGVVFDWYKSRLSAMFGRMPCRQALYVNHLLGTCPRCGSGKYAKSKFPIQYVSIGRVFACRQTSPDYIKRLMWLHIKQGFDNLQTNLEYPLPTVRVGSGTYLPDFYDSISNSAIHFLRHTPNNKRIARALAEELNTANIGLKLYDPKDEVWWSFQHGIDLTAAKARHGSKSKPGPVDGSAKTVDGKILPDERSPF